MLSLQNHEAYDSKAQTSVTGSIYDDCNVVSSSGSSVTFFPRADYNSGFYERIYDVIQDHVDYKKVDVETMPKQIMMTWHKLYESKFSDKTANRIKYLASHLDGWRGLHSRALHTASLANFLDFWLSIKDKAVEPEIVLCGNGNLQAEWYKSNRKSLFIEFKESNGEAVFCFSDNKSIIDGKEKIRPLAQMLKARSINPFKWKYD